MKKNSRKTGSIVAIAILLVVALAVNIACASLKSMITSWMGVNLNPMLTGSKAEGSAEILSVADATEQSLRMAEELEKEGIVLLRNENGALPLASGAKVNLFGYASIDPIYGGTGSGSGDTSANVDVVKGLENAGFTVNPDLVNFYKSPKQGGYTGSNFTPTEVPASAYSDAVLAQAKAFSDIAIVVLSRIGGEGGDLPQDMYAAGYSETDDGRHYLELTQDEEDLIALVKAQDFTKTVVLINSSNAMELGFVENGVDAVLWIGSPGAVGCNAVGAVLSGEVNPSGRLVDTYAYDLTVETSGRSSAAIRTDRGGGTVVVDGGSYTSNGLGSPAIYSTADITVANAQLTSNLSEGVCIEGLNSITLNNCDLTANNTKCNGNATFLDTIMIYQSMSGDAASGTSSFTMTDGSLTSKNGHVFHVTNTSAVITLQNVEIVNEDEDNILLSVCADGWSGGSNIAALKAIRQELSGAVLVGSDSSLTLELTDGSAFEGYIDGNITNASGEVVSTEAGTVSVTLDSTSSWTLTGDSYITEFNGDASNVITNGYTLYVNGVALTGTN